MDISEFQLQLNEWGQYKVPFLFVVDFEMKKPLAWRIADVEQNKIAYHFKGFTNSQPTASRNITLKKNPISFEQYQTKFDQVMRELQYGNSFLTNLTVKTQIELEHSLRELFDQANAPYKLWYDDQFLVFSPETFVSIRGGKIFSHPMKGTIDARIPEAKEIILSDEKELAEHVTIVDLIRNDLSQVANNVHVSRFRYIDRIETNEVPLLQVSSEIVGDLPTDYASKLGTILVSLLPAGSISGAPKDKTIGIIQKAEVEARGYYTGVFGYFDGENLQSAVMIRYIEKIKDKYFYRSGGGITTQSTARAEYDELLTKVYVPVV